MSEELVIDEIFDKQPWLGEAVCCMPENQNTELDATKNIGGCSGLYYSLTFQLPKWGYTLKKLDEWMDVSPVYAEAYNLTIEQKHKLEAQIKEGLRSAAQSVADFELLKHDYRKYREILDFWKKGQKDDHILRSLFIDRVDVYVGENFSMVSMVKRWPTIISDFIRMSKEMPDEEEQEDVDKIRTALGLTKAEAHVLKTKNVLYKKWKESFFPEVKDRFARIKNLVQAREKSVDEYREWLKPYVARYRLLAESTQRKPQKFTSDPYMAPAFGNAWSSSGIRFICWQPFYPPEGGKPQRMSTLSPIDKFVFRYAKKIEERYKVKMDEARIKKILASAMKQDVIDPSKRTMTDGTVYYIGFDIIADKTLIKMPKGGEQEDMVFKIKHWVMSQNVILVILMETEAREEAFNRYVNEIIGTKEVEQKIRDEVEAEFFPKKEEKVNFERIKKIGSGFRRAGRIIYRLLEPFKPYFFRPGPYESNFKERITKSFMIPMGSSYFNKLVKFMKWKMGVPGMPEEY